jgi:myo-inositol-1(or 4)-monophosphatase
MSFTEKELDEILKEAVDVANDAGALLLEALNRPKRIEYKGVVDLVTEYDMRAEELIIRRLENSFPGIAMLAEESADEQSTKTATRWIVDPLDGTTNFSHGHPFFAVSIGLEDQGALAAGAIIMPALGMSMWARLAGGAFCNGERILVSSTKNLDQSLVSTGFPYDRRTAVDDNTSEYRAFIKRSQGVRRCGSASIDLALVARGVYDGYWEPRLRPWDIAGGIVIVNEAGGRATNYEGGPVDLGDGWIVASNGLIHDQMIDVIKEARNTL